MKYDRFRRSNNVEDLRDPNKPVDNRPEAFETLTERIELNNSQLSEDAGSKDIR